MVVPTARGAGGAVRAPSSRCRAPGGRAARRPGGGGARSIGGAQLPEARPDAHPPVKRSACPEAFRPEFLEMGSFLYWHRDPWVPEVKRNPLTRWNKNGYNV